MSALATLGEGVERCIEVWARNGSTTATRTLGEFVLAFGDEILGERGGGLLSDHPIERARVARWLLDSITRERLESAFFDDAASPDARECAEAADLIAGYAMTRTATE